MQVNLSSTERHSYIQYPQLGVQTFGLGYTGEIGYKTNFGYTLSATHLRLPTVKESAGVPSVAEAYFGLGHARYTFGYRACNPVLWPVGHTGLVNPT